MSQYISFYIKNKDTFTELFYLSRSTYTYKYLNGPYGCVTKLTQEKIFDAMRELEEELNDQKANIEREEVKLKRFGETKPEYKDWNKAYCDTREFIGEYEDEINCIENAISQLSVLKLIADNCKYSDEGLSLWYGTEVERDENGNPKVWENANSKIK